MMRQLFCQRFLPVLSFLGFLSFGHSNLWADPSPSRGFTKTFVLWKDQALSEDQNDQQGFFSMLESIGFHPVKLGLDDLATTALTRETMIAVPNCSARDMASADVSQVLASANKGTRVLTDGDSALLRQLQIKLSDPVAMKRIVYAPEKAGEVEWSSSATVSSLQLPASADVKTIYATEDNRPLVVVGRVGQGSYLAIGPLFDPVDGRGYARFPNVLNAIVDDMAAEPAFRRNGIDAYLDMADRVNSDYEALAKQWRQSGIHAMYVSAWYFDDPAFHYDALIKAAHRNGVLVYPWFQWPHVSRKFWDEHPAWREKTATLADANVDWRLLMNFQNPDCRSAVLAETRAFLRNHDWDGVNIAEFYFESYAGPSAPEIFTPMNDIARSEFKAKAGFDPIDLFAPASRHFWQRDENALAAYFRYRVQVMNRLYDTFVGEINSVARKKNVRWPILWTTIDGLTHPELADYYNIDLRHIGRLLKANGGVLQLEDEFFDWKLGPDRYTRLGQRYAQAFPTVKFMIDVNVVSEGVDPGTRFPTLEPTGSELVQIYHAASRASSGVAFYSEHSVRDWDWPLMPYAMAADVVADWGNSDVKISAPFQVALSYPAADASVDGEAWGCGDESAVLLPAGDHTVQFKAGFTGRPTLYLRRLSGELIDCRRKSGSLGVAYASPGRCLLLVTEKPAGLRLDGKMATLPVESGDGGFTVFAPAGNHQIEFLKQAP